MQIREVLNERARRYGHFKDTASIAQGLKDEMRTTPRWNDLTPVMREALEMTANKLARILNGDPYYTDSWVDMAGYIQLVVDSLEPSDG